MQAVLEKSSHLSMDQIRSYLSHDASDEARYSTERHMLACPLCQEAVEGYMRTHTADVDESLNRVNTSIRKRVQSQQTRVYPMIRHRPVVNQIAAVALVLILLTSGWMYWQHTEPQRLYAQYHHTYSSGIYSGERSENSSSVPASVKSALQAYEKGDYKKAAQGLSAYLSSHPDYIVGRFFYGLSQLELHQPQQAIPALEHVVNAATSYTQDAQWYLALAYVADDQVEQARPLLQTLSESGSRYYADSATSLLLDL